MVNRKVAQRCGEKQGKPTKRPGCVWAREYADARNAFPFLREWDEHRRAIDENCFDAAGAQWCRDLDTSRVLFHAMEHGDVGAYAHAERAALEHLPAPVAEAFVMVLHYARNTPGDRLAAMMARNVLNAACYYPAYIHALADYATEGDGHA